MKKKKTEKVLEPTLNQERLNEYFTGAIAKHYHTNDKDTIDLYIKNHRISTRVVDTPTGQYLTILKKGQQIIAQTNLLYFLNLPTGQQ